MMWYKLNADKTTTPLPKGEYPDMVDKIVEQTQLEDCWVSTVFLGLDHGWGNTEPVLFETMIFGGPHDQHQWRYNTYAEAEAGHKRIVNLVKEGKNPTE